MIKKNKINKNKEKASIANTMAYMVQDMLDDLGRGGRFSFNRMEKQFKKLLNDL